MRTLIILWLLLGLERLAAAADYEAFIDVASEPELYDLLESEQISGESLDILIELLRHGVDLEHATRDELYGLPNLSYQDVDRILAFRARGRIGDPRRLVLAGVLSADKLKALLPFLRQSSASPWRSFWHAPLVYVAATGDPPAAAMQGELFLYGRFTVGAAALSTRRRLAEVGYDPSRDALVAQEEGPALHVPKLYLRFDSPHFAAIAGSYRIGFGERLTFDDTTRLAPHGFVIDDEVMRGTSLPLACKESAGELAESPCAGGAHATPDFHWREGLFGGALRLDLGQLSLHGFFSSSRRPVYQYELFDRARCSDPRANLDPACDAPFVFKRQEDPFEPTSRFAYSTLPDLFRETLFGGNLTWWAGTRAHLGASAYVAQVSWLAGGMALDFQEWARYPRGGNFGALGIDGAVHLGRTDVAVELSRSFDGTPASQGGGGDFAGVVRTTSLFGHHELEAVARYYGTGFANPYARPVAEPDEYGGQRARDEAGLRLRYRAGFDRLTLRAASDVWTPPSQPELRMAFGLRADVAVLHDFQLGVSSSFQSRDRKLRAALHMQVVAAPVTLAAQYSHALVDDVSGARRHDASASLTATLALTDALGLRARARYADAALFDDMYLESLLVTSGELSYALPYGSLALRYERRAYLDERESTRARMPNPEHWLLVDLQARF